MLLRQIDLSSWLGPISVQTQATSENVQLIREMLTADLGREILDPTDRRDFSADFIRENFNPPPNYHFESDEDIV